ncbi:MAG: hypothetical protein M0R30_04410 [Methanoregula sp.]|uniref:hypothetical protein n=1 Tax=Methanoregula sp. TaxID=2052170 RepID=UPI0025D5F849|nr:hypothetical protein [Methanoregula sp.]MCK9630862.1 hypothetical protein [Methanoregula sp.]
MERRDAPRKSNAFWIQQIDLMVETGMISDWAAHGACVIQDRAELPCHARVMDGLLQGAGEDPGACSEKPVCYQKHADK